MPSRRTTLVIVATLLLGCMLYVSSQGGTVDNPITTVADAPRNQETNNARDAHNVRGIDVERIPVEPTTAAPQSRDCFHNRVFFQPVVCSKLVDVVSKGLELMAPGENTKRTWNIAHVGTRDALMKLAEVIDVFGDVLHGSAGVGRMLRLAGAKHFCGACCECVGSEDIRSFKVKYNATLFWSPDENDRTPSVDGWWSEQSLDGARTVVSLATNSIGQCPSSVPEQVHDALIAMNRPIDILSLDSWKCDHAIITRLVADERLRPEILEFTSVADVSYEMVVNSLSLDYVCFYLTTKPEHKRFRGMRPPVFPVAVRLSGCWRGIYDSFKHERYHITCHRKHSRFEPVLSTLSRMPHKGQYAGCALPYRTDRLKKFNVSR